MSVIIERQIELFVIKKCPFNGGAYFESLPGCRPLKPPIASGYPSEQPKPFSSNRIRRLKGHGSLRNQSADQIEKTRLLKEFSAQYSGTARNLFHARGNFA